MVSMKTAEDVLYEQGCSGYCEGAVFSESFYETEEIVKAMIEFAKMHVENAKKEYERIILQEGLVTEAGVLYLDNAYPLDLIK